jgi:hypothetical protein
MTTSSQRHVAVLASPLLKPGKTYHSRAYCSKDTGNRRTKSLKDKRKRALVITDEETKFNKIRRRQTSAHSAVQIDPSPEWRLDGRTLFHLHYVIVGNMHWRQ